MNINKICGLWQPILMASVDLGESNVNIFFRLDIWVAGKGEMLIVSD